MIFRKNIELTGVIFILITSMGCLDRTITKEIHYITKPFIGQVVINFNISQGERREFLHDSRIYRIPISGVLNTRFGPNTGWAPRDSTFKFYYYDSIKGTKELLTRIDRFTEEQKLKFDSNSVVVKQLGYMKRYNAEGKQIESLSYYVDTLKNFKHYRPD